MNGGFYDITNPLQKYHQAKSEANVNLTQMQRELESLRALQEKFMNRTRELEIDCDELERNERFVFFFKKKK